MTDHDCVTTPRRPARGHWEDGPGSPYHGRQRFLPGWPLNDTTRFKTMTIPKVF
jgi:hypothetical protein